MCNQNEGSATTEEDSSNEEASHQQQEPADEQHNDISVMESLLRTDSLVEDTILAGNQTPQYDAFLQSLSNHISSYLSKKLPEQIQSKATTGGDSQEAIVSRTDKSSRIQRKPPKRVKRTKS